MREETREGEAHEDWNSKESGFGLKEWISMEEASESKSCEAITANRLNADSTGSQRTASMYLYCGNLWICWLSEIAVTAIARVFLQQQQKHTKEREGGGTCFSVTKIPLSALALFIYLNQITRLPFCLFFFWVIDHLKFGQVQVYGQAATWKINDNR